MSKTKKTALILPLLVIPLCCLLVIPIPVASQLEENDAFCTSCHLAPEATYFSRAQAATAAEEIPMDLASAHYQAASLETDEAFRCIDCHRGDDSLNDRAHALLLGARDTLTFLSGQADQTIEKRSAEAPELLERSCLKCHTETVMERGFNNHYHNQLPHAAVVLEAGAEPYDPPGGMTPGDLFTEMGGSDTTVQCASCHQAHVSIPDGDLTLYMDVDNVLLPACEQCHLETGHGPTDLTNPGG